MLDEERRSEPKESEMTEEQWQAIFNDAEANRGSDLMDALILLARYKAIITRLTTPKADTTEMKFVTMWNDTEIKTGILLRKYGVKNAEQ